MNLENRFLAGNGSVCKLLVDGTDFKINQTQNFKKRVFLTNLVGYDTVTKSPWTFKQAILYGVIVPFHLGPIRILLFFCRVSHTTSNQVREWTLIGATGVGRGLFTFPTQMLVQGPYSELLRHLCARGMSCATVGSKHSRFWALLTAILARSMACIFDAYLSSRNFPLKLILVYLKSLIRR